MPQRERLKVKQLDAAAITGRPDATPDDAAWTPGRAHRFQPRRVPDQRLNYECPALPLPPPFPERLQPWPGQDRLGRPADRFADNAPRWKSDSPHYAAKAKRVIHLFMAGAPSQLELFDHKPMLTKFEGKPIPPEVIGGQRYAFIRPDAAALGPRFQFSKHGQSGIELGESLPHSANIVDEITRDQIW